MEPNAPPLLPLLKQYFGFRSFRPLQEEIIRDALAGKDVFALLPTGGGKSLCFQLPAMTRPGLTVVVSPLIALMDAWGKWTAIEVFLTVLALVNALASAGDVLGMLLIAWQVPAAAVVRNRGWRTYWKLPVDGSR